jgi:nucleoredoxin
LKLEEKTILRAQTLESLLVSDEGDFVIEFDDGDSVRRAEIPVPVFELVGKTIALFFFINQYYDSYFQFTLKLIRVYKEMKERGEVFEVVLIGDKGET